MYLLRRNKLVPLLLALAVVFSALGWPVAAAAACGAAAVPPRSQASSADHCAMRKTGPCCCPEKCKSGTIAKHSGAAGVASSCPCSVQAPDSVPPAPSKPVALIAPAQLALLPAPSLVLSLPAQVSWRPAAPTIGPPGGPTLPSGPSRAPPTFG